MAVVHIWTPAGCALTWWKSEFLLAIIESSASMDWVMSQQVICDNAEFQKCTLAHSQQHLCISVSTSSWLCVSHISPAWKVVQIIVADQATGYYPPVRLRCLYISNLGDQVGDCSLESHHYLPLIGWECRESPPWAEISMWIWPMAQGTCPQPSAPIWQMILYQRPLHWFGW